jgi:two-component system cell cycle response regulator DivK
MAHATILLIEDSPTYAKLATLLLQGSGWAVIKACTAEEGLRLAREATPDLILMDIHLPGMDGFRAVRIIREDSHTMHIPTLALTADRIWSADEHEKALEAGFNAYLTKPTDEETFRAVVGPFLGSPEGAR